MLKLAQLHCCCTLLSFTTFKIKIEDGNACCYKKKIIVVYASTDMWRSTCLFYCLFSQLTHISCADYVRVYRAWQSPCILCVKTTKALISSEKTFHPHCYMYTALYYTCVPIFFTLALEQISTIDYKWDDRWCQENTMILLIYQYTGFQNKTEISIAS